MKKNKICVIGLGYVGLPIFVELSKYYETYGYDINTQRINTLKKGVDKNLEFKKKDLKKYSKFFINDVKKKKFNFYIVTVPTPIFSNKKPNLIPLKKAMIKINKNIKKDDIVIVESTVYPGVTEDICLNILKKSNSLDSPKDFVVGYSPERINPGDKKHELTSINKIISINSKNREIIKRVKQVYSKISKKLIFSNSIKESETAKAIENIQRDLNIGFINEVYKFCKTLNLDFKEVIRLANSKWNFMHFNPGLVGGHCLPVDPYYLSYIAKKKKLNMKILLAGREVNNGMKDFIILEIKNEIKRLNLDYKKDRIIFLGITYKPNVSDVRNSIALEIFKYFNRINKNVRFHDPIANIYDKKILKYKLNTFKNHKKFKTKFVVLVNHNIFKKSFKNLSKNIINIFA